MLICITNRKLCPDDFLGRIKRLAQGQPQAIMLREKDLSPAEYKRIAESVRSICRNYQVPLIINKFWEAAAELECEVIHLSMPDLREYRNKPKGTPYIGASVHSVSEAEEAQRLGAAYLIAGHIFPTESKKGIPPRGLSFLRDVCTAVDIPVYAIGGITADKVKDVLEAGACGVCIMSEAMVCAQPEELISRFRAIIGS